MGAREAETDAEVLASVAPATHDRWRDLFAMTMWTQRAAHTDGDVDQLLRHLYELSLIVPFNWPDWYSPDLFRSGQGLDPRRSRTPFD